MKHTAGKKRSHHKPHPVGRPPKVKKGRPRKTVSENEIVRLAAEGSTSDYIASRLGISRWLLYKRHKKALDRGRSLRDGDIQRKQFAVAMSGCASMLVWLGKQWLNQKDKVETVGATDPLAQLLKSMRAESERLGPPEQDPLSLPAASDNEFANSINMEENPQWMNDQE
jgi:DNA-binding CsgD family transcriptional regulator